MIEPDLDPVLSARLRELAEQRVATRIQAAKQQADQRKQTRAEFGQRRRIGVEKRHAAKQARQNLINRHGSKEQ